ncbi:mCG148310 [Mus musculus]|nr:mCG148310 [Mus musculus]
MVLYAFNPSTGRQRGRWISVGSRPTWSTKPLQEIQGYTVRLCLRYSSQATMNDNLQLSVNTLTGFNIL